MKVSVLLVLSLLGWEVKVLADDALKHTQDRLTSPTARAEDAKKNPDAQKVANSIKALTGGNGELTDEVYKLAAEVFANVVKDCKGDPKKMQEAMAKFQRDPASFTETWTPEQKQKLSDLAKKIEPVNIQH